MCVCVCVCVCGVCGVCVCVCVCVCVNGAFNSSVDVNGKSKIQLTVSLLKQVSICVTHELNMSV